MDFVTRDRYRHVVENVAKTTKLSETEVAEAAIKLSGEQAGNKTGIDRRTLAIS